jgi:hypothetical protein
LTNSILDKLSALPLHDIITYDQSGTLFISGKQVDIEYARNLKESAIVVLKSNAFRAVHEQVNYNAITVGVHKAENSDHMIFSKAAIWFGQREIELLKLLAQDGGKLSPEDLA